MLLLLRTRARTQPARQASRAPQRAGRRQLARARRLKKPLPPPSPAKPRARASPYPTPPTRPLPHAHLSLSLYSNPVLNQSTPFLRSLSLTADFPPLSTRARVVGGGTARGGGRGGGGGNRSLSVPAASIARYPHAAFSSRWISASLFSILSFFFLFCMRGGL